jgi:hypothetical protein
MLSKQPLVRNACEECHDRKIRCSIPPKGGACIACQTHGRQCFFLPRYKSGRPRRNRSSSPDLFSRQDLRTSILSPSSLQEGQHISDMEDWESVFMSVSTKDPSLDQESAALRSLREENTFGQSNSRLDPWLDTPMNNNNIFSNPPTATPPSFPESSLPVFPIPTSPKSSTFPAPSLSGFVTPWTQRLLGRQLEKDNGFPVSSSTSSSRESSVPTASSVWTASPPSESTKPEQAVDGNFSCLLKQCIKLQQHIEEIKENDLLSSDSSTSKDKLQSTLISIDSSCNNISGFFGGPLPNSAPSPQNASLESALLAITTVLKVFELCDTLVQNKVPNVQSLDYILLIKRLEFNITQARIALVRIGRLEQSLSPLAHDAIGKALLLDRRLKSRMEDQSMWV